ncbi:MAG: DUF4124 domain-containing protein [Pseudomonadota bacterium]
MKNQITSFICVAVLALSIGASANDESEVYKWTDANGRVHYSDKPDNVDHEVLNIKSRRTDKAAIARAVQVRIDDQQSALADAAAKAMMDAERQQNEDVREENCRRATEAVTSLRNATRLYLPGENGERRYLSDDEIAERLKQAEKDKADWCAER